MSKTYIGDRQLGRTKQGGFHVNFWIDEDNVKLLCAKPSQEIINHSPNGFNWGYGGSGPAQLALALLYDVTKDKDLSLRYYQDFKFEIIASLRDIWELTESEILDWIKSKVQ